MAFHITLNDNTETVQAQMQGNKLRTLTAMGLKAVELTLKKMEKGYSIAHANRAHGAKYIKVFKQRLKNSAYQASDGGRIRRSATPAA